MCPLKREEGRERGKKERGREESEGGEERRKKRRKKENLIMLNTKTKLFYFHCYYLIVPEGSQPSKLAHLLIVK